MAESVSVSKYNRITLMMILQLTACRRSQRKTLSLPRSWWRSMQGRTLQLRYGICWCTSLSGLHPRLAPNADHCVTANCSLCLRRSSLEARNVHARRASWWRSLGAGTQPRPVASTVFASPPLSDKIWHCTAGCAPSACSRCGGQFCQAPARRMTRSILCVTLTWPSSVCVVGAALQACSDLVRYEELLQPREFVKPALF